MIEDSFISYDEQGRATSFVGTDAVKLYQAAVLVQAIKMAGQGIVATRGFTLNKGLKMASQITGRAYYRTDADLAIRDLKVWIAEMRDALPQVQR